MIAHLAIQIGYKRIHWVHNAQRKYEKPKTEKRKTKNEKPPKKTSDCHTHKVI